jgi:arylsulfatase A-like enzyme
MSRANVLCIAIDGWHGGYVGAYGNTQFPTPGIDRWAARGVVCDQAMVAGVGTGVGIEADSEFGIRDSGAVALGLARALAQGGWRTSLVSDDVGAVKSIAPAFDAHVDVPYEPAKRAAVAIEGTQLFRMFAALGDAVGDAAADGAAEDTAARDERPFFIWAHARAMNGGWDAPYAMRRLILDEDDPDPPRELQFSPRRLAANVDPDLLLGLRAAYAGQIAVLDECLAALDDLLDETRLRQRTLVALVGVRGYPLGEHGIFGLGLGPLHEELLHVPLILRFPGDEHATVRLPQLVTHADLLPTVCDACGVPMPAANAASLMPIVTRESGAWRDHVCHRLADEEAITTPAWRLRKSADTVQLYVKPDDRWEVNDVSTRCGDVAEKLVAAMQAARESEARGETPPALEDVLRAGL